MLPSFRFSPSFFLDNILSTSPYATGAPGAPDALDVFGIDDQSVDIAPHRYYYGEGEKNGWLKSHHYSPPVWRFE